MVALAVPLEQPWQVTSALLQWSCQLPAVWVQGPWSGTPGWDHHNQMPSGQRKQQSLLLLSDLLQSTNTARIGFMGNKTTQNSHQGKN